MLNGGYVSSGTTAYGSCLLYVTRSDPQGKDVHSLGLAYNGWPTTQSDTIAADFAGCAAPELDANIGIWLS